MLAWHAVELAFISCSSERSRRRYTSHMTLLLRLIAIKKKREMGLNLADNKNNLSSMAFSSNSQYNLRWWRLCLNPLWCNSQWWYSSLSWSNNPSWCNSLCNLWCSKLLLLRHLHNRSCHSPWWLLNSKWCEMNHQHELRNLRQLLYQIIYIILL